jgi:hypothetical protein
LNARGKYLQLSAPSLLLDLPQMWSLSVDIQGQFATRSVRPEEQAQAQAKAKAKAKNIRKSNSACMYTCERNNTKNGSETIINSNTNSQTKKNGMKKQQLEYLFRN